VLRGIIPTSDEEMWADGMRLAEENAVSELDEDGDEEVEELDEELDTEDDVILETSLRATPPPTVTVTSQGRLIRISPAPEGDEGKVNVGITPPPAREEAVLNRDSGTAAADEKLISISPDGKSETGKENSKTQMGDEPEHMFDRDIDAELRKEQEGCSVQ
jgi:hypothetical protein